MANNKIGMKQIRQIYRLYTQGVSKVQISQRLLISRNTVKKYLEMFKRQRLTYDDIKALSDSDLGNFLSTKEEQIPVKLVQLQALFTYFERELGRPHQNIK